MNAVLLISFCLGNIVGPLTFTQQSAPNYIPAKITIIVTCSVSVVLTLALRVYYTWENKKRASGQRDHLVEGKTEEEILAMGDESPRFVFAR